MNNNIQTSLTENRSEMVGFRVTCNNNFELLRFAKDDKVDRVDDNSFLKIGVKLLLGSWVPQCGRVIAWKAASKYAWNLKREI